LESGQTDKISKKKRLFCDKYGVFRTKEDVINYYNDIVWEHNQLVRKKSRLNRRNYGRLLLTEKTTKAYSWKLQIIKEKFLQGSWSISSLFCCTPRLES